MKIVSCITVLLAALIFGTVSTASAQNSDYVTTSGKQFVLASSGSVFVPWGNDESYPGYYDDIELANGNWPQLVANFEYLKSIGTNTVRIFPQFGEIMGESPTTTNAANLQQLANIINLANSLSMRVDITGLDVIQPGNPTIDPTWYDSLSEQARWAAQATYWSAVAQTVMGCSGKNAVFCYDLTNEPIAPTTDQTTWYTGQFAGDYFDQYLVENIDDPVTHRKRSQETIATEWIQNLTTAIRNYDPEHLITVGNLSMEWDFGGFMPKKVAPYLNFISAHDYPQPGQVATAISYVDGCVTGKPILVEETMNLYCSAGDESQFLLQSNIDNGGVAAGWIGHFNGTTIQQVQNLIANNTASSNQIMGEQWLLLSEDPTDSYFSLPTVAPGQIAPDPAAVPWIYTGASGLAANGSALTDNNENPPDNSQVAYLQPTGSISQSLYFGHKLYYQVSIVAATEADAPASAISVTCNGVPIGTPLILSSTNYESYQTIPFTIGDKKSGFYPLTITETGQSGSAALIDEVQIDSE